MENLGISLLIGAALAPSVMQSFSSVTKTAQNTSDSIENLKIGKYWADELIKVRGEIEDNTRKMAELGETAEDIELKQNLIARLEEAKKKAAEFGISLENAAEESERLGGELAKVDAAAQKMELKTEGFSKLRTAAMDFAKLSGGVMAAKSAFMGIVSPAVAFESNMANVSTLVDTSIVNMEKLSDTALDLSKNFGLTQESVTSGMYQALSAGVEVENLSGFMETAAKMAVGGNIDIATAIDGMSSAVNAYGAANLSAQKASDIMFQTANRGKTDVRQLSASLSNVTPIASALGVQFGDVSAAIATLTYSGTPTAQATTQIRAALSELSKESTKVSQVFKESAGVSFQEYIAQGHNLGEAFDLISQKARQQGKNLTDLFGSVEGAQAVMALTGAASERFSEDLKIMGDSAGATTGAFNKMSETSAFRLAQLSSNFDGLKTSVGVALLPVLEITTTVLGKIVNLFAWLNETAPILVPIATGILGVVGGILALNKAVTITKTIMTALNLIIAANPIMLIVTAVTTAIALIITYWDKISNFFGWVSYGLGLTDEKPTDKKIAKKSEADNGNGTALIDAVTNGNGNKTALINAVTNSNTEAVAKLPEIQKVDPLKAATKTTDTQTAIAGTKSYRVAQSQIPASSKTVNVTISNFTINSQSIEEALPRVKDKIVAIVREAANEGMENSYAY